ncbi:MAG: hypothetical protein U5K76_09560 [Woeseiaceae bacterium]|nr:hypothetical protein [Woeseiaceae bacterium]
MALSTWLPLADTLQAEVVDKRDSQSRDLPVFLAHGTYDPMLPLALGEFTRDTLQRAGFAPEWHSYPMADASLRGRNCRDTRLAPARVRRRSGLSGRQPELRVAGPAAMRVEAAFHDQSSAVVFLQDDCRATRAVILGADERRRVAARAIANGRLSSSSPTGGERVSRPVTGKARRG